MNSDEHWPGIGITCNSAIQTHRVQDGIGVGRPATAVSEARERPRSFARTALSSSAIIPAIVADAQREADTAATRLLRQPISTTRLSVVMVSSSQGWPSWTGWVRWTSDRAPPVACRQASERVVGA